MDNFNWLKQKKYFCLCMYKMVVEITKETWGKCGIKRLYLSKKSRKNK